MVDIHPLKNLLNVILYMKEGTLSLLLIGIGIYTIYIVYLILFERYYNNKQTHTVDIQPESSIGEILSSLSCDDHRFFEKLSFLIRSYLERTGRVPLATRKTQREIERIDIGKDIKNILRICAHYEYTGEQSSREEKEKIVNQIRNVFYSKLTGITQ